MFNWFKRKVQVAQVRQVTEDIDRFIAGLRGADVKELSMIVAVATHWRHVFEKEGADLLDPAEADRRDSFLALKINKLIAQVQKENAAFATGLMVWLHTLRAARHAEIRLQGRHMWAELERGFDGVDEAAEDLALITGTQLQTHDAARIPIGLEPNFR